jgi:hypothetical protein
MANKAAVWAKHSVPFHRCPAYSTIDSFGMGCTIRKKGIQM